MKGYIVYEEREYYPSAQYFSKLKKARAYVEKYCHEDNITIAKVTESNYEYGLDEWD